MNKPLDEEVYLYFMEVGRPITTEEVNQAFPGEPILKVSHALADLIRNEVVRWLYRIGECPTDNDATMLVLVQ